MKRLVVVIFTFALLFISAGKLSAGCIVRYYHHGSRPVVVCGGYHRAWIRVIGDGVGDITAISGFTGTGIKLRVCV